MSALSKILNILVLLLAIVTLVFGFMLFNKRNQLRAHSDVMGNALADVAEEIELGKSAAYGENGDGELGYKANESDLKSITADIVSQAQDLKKQRNDLGVGIHELATKFELVEDLNPEDLAKMDTYEEKLATIAQGVDAAKNRNSELVQGILTVSQGVDGGVAAGDLGSADSVRSAVDKLDRNIKSLNTSNENYEAALTAVVSALGPDFESVSVQELAKSSSFVEAKAQLDSSLASISSKLNEFAAKEKQIKELKADIKTKDDVISSHVTTIDDQRVQVTTLTDKVVQLQTELDKIGKVTDGGNNGELVGKVVQVNYDWSYVIINLGAKDNLPENLTMIVSRDREYITQVLVTKVYKEYAIAEIIPDHQQGQVLENDTVFFAQ